MKRESINRYVSSIGIFSLFALLYVISNYNYLLFHTAAELFSICVAFCIFIFAYYSRRFMDNDYFMFLGIAYLFIACLDLVHTLGYKGMGVFENDNPNLSVQLWIASRYLESGSLLASFLFLKKKTNAPLVICTYIAILSFVFATIFVWEVFPTCFIEGEGLTTFKVASEYIISFLLILAIIFLFGQKENFDKKVFFLMTIAFSLTIVSELFFTFYISVYGISNLIGHMFKVLSFYCIFTAIVQVGLKKPYDLMFRDIHLKDQELVKAHNELRNLLEKRTNKLHRSTEKLEKEMVERHQVELFLEQSKKDYRLLAENIRDVIWTSDLSLKWSYISPSIKRITGFSHTETMTFSIDQIMNPASVERSHQALATALEQHKENSSQDTSKTIETEFYHKNGSLVWVEIRADIQTDSQGNPIGVIGVARDISDRKKAEEENKKLEARLYKQQKMEATGRLAGGIAHDFNNLLNVMLTNSELLLEDDKTENEIAEWIGNIQEAVSRAKKVVGQLLSFSRGDPQKIAPMDIGQVVKDTARLLRSSTPLKVQVTISADDGPFKIMADPTQIHQIVLNLVTNAIDAIGNNTGKVDVSLSHVSLKKTTGPLPANLSLGDYVKLSVSDTGHGISPGNMERIFDPYFTTKAKGKGTGLGLSVVQGIVKKSSGEILVHSEPGKGTTFDLYFMAIESQKKNAA